jgi:outer membrane protein OmpA-like peptidoglycan-associated protein
MVKSVSLVQLIILSVTTLFLNACAQNLTEINTPSIKPCIIPSDRPDNAMGRLGIQTIHIGDTYRIIVPVDPVFNIRSAEIQQAAYPGLTMLSQHIKRAIPACITVTGYTDSLGSYPDDQWLSEKQARSLITYFWTQGVPHECLKPVGIGKDDAYTVASNRSVEGAVANRRIEITYRSHQRPQYALFSWF